MQIDVKNNLYMKSPSQINYFVNQVSSNDGALFLLSRVGNYGVRFMLQHGLPKRCFLQR